MPLRVSITEAGAHSSVALTDRIPASKGPFTPGTRGYHTIGGLFSVPPTTIAGTTYTIDDDDLGAVLDFTSSSAVTVTLPKTLPAGFSCVVCQAGTGQVTLSPESGATYKNAGDGLGNKYYSTFAQDSEITIRVRSNSDDVSAVWVTSGDMV
jgi:hypothetical protein